MSQKPVTMEQIKQILQLINDGIAIREIARRLGISRTSVKKYIQIFEKQQPDHPPLTNVQIAETAYNNDVMDAADKRLQALMEHFPAAQKELSKTGVTRQLLWKEYKEANPDGYNYSQYCFHFTRYLQNKDLAMHPDYTPGDIMMIDFAGKKLQYVVSNSGEVIECQVFVSVLPYSGLIFCKAVPSQQTADFADCINAMLKFYGGVPGTILCDNLKTAVIRPSRYEPIFTDICLQLSEHYQTTFSATRPYSPRDKGMVERSVNIVYNHIYGLLRNDVYHSLEALNHAIKIHLSTLNHKPYKNTAYSRWYYFEMNEMKTLKALPNEAFMIKKTVTVTVQRNYHVQLSEDKLYFSVPYSYVGKKVKVLYNSHTVEVYYEYARIALHIRKSVITSYTTTDDHMPPNHRSMKDAKGWTKEKLLAQAGQVGEHTRTVAEHLLSNSIYMEQNYKACFGMIMLHKKYTIPRLEAACNRALVSPRINYTLIKNILEKGLDRQQELFNETLPPEHENIRGPKEYK